MAWRDFQPFFSIFDIAQRLAAQMRGYQEPLHHIAVFEVRLHDFVNVLLVYIGVPDRLRVDDGNRPGGTTIKATRLVDPDLARPGQASCLDLGFAAVKAGLGALIGTAIFSALALVQAEKNVPLVVRVSSRSV